MSAVMSATAVSLSAVMSATAVSQSAMMCAAGVHSSSPGIFHVVLYTTVYVYLCTYVYTL